MKLPPTFAVLSSLGVVLLLLALAGPSAAQTTTTTSSTTTISLPAPSAAIPEAGCFTGAPGKSRLKLTSKGGFKDKFKWKLGKTQATLADFRDPIAGPATYRVSLYDSSAELQPLMDMALPAGGTCGEKPCWKTIGANGYKYKDQLATPNGITKGKLKAKDSSRSKVQFRGKGINLPTPTLPLAFPVTAQLVVSDGVTLTCWQTVFVGAKKNEPDRLKASGP